MVCRDEAVRNLKQIHLSQIRASKKLLKTKWIWKLIKEKYWWRNAGEISKRKHLVTRWNDSVKAKRHLKWISSSNCDPFKQITRRMVSWKHKTKMISPGLLINCVSTSFFSFAPARVSFAWRRRQHVETQRKLKPSFGSISSLAISFVTLHHINITFVFASVPWVRSNWFLCNYLGSIFQSSLLKFARPGNRAENEKISWVIANCMAFNYRKLERVSTFISARVREFVMNNIKN